MRRFAAATLVCLALAVLHTWPIASGPQRHSLNYNADAELNAWIVSWIAYALPHEPRRLFAGNIFQPDDHALAYSEPLVVPALAGAPIRWMGGSAVLTFNLLLIAGLAATGAATWLVAARWTGSFYGGLVAAALAAFNTHLLTRLPHLQAAHAWGLPLVLYLTDLLLARDAPTRRCAPAIVALGLVIAATAATSEYWLFFAAVLMAVQVAVGARSRRVLGHMALAGGIAGILALPVLLPYLRLAGEGVRRPLEQAAQLSATPWGYLTSLSRLDALWSHRFFTRDIDVLFPGIAATLLAVVGLVAAFRAGGPARRRSGALVAIAVIGVVMSLGPATPLYPLAYRVVIPLQGLRVLARFGYLALLAVALLAGYGVAALQRRLTFPWRSAAGALALCAVTVEAWHGPVRTTPFAGVPRIYSVLAQEPPGSLLVEAPFWPAEAVFGNAEYVLNATEHRTPTMNGYSGFTPDAYRRRAQWFWFFPEPWAIAAMRREGATHVMVHLEQFGPEAASVKQTLETQSALQLIAEDPLGHRLYRFQPEAESEAGGKR
jgi:hypothetical protein